MIGVKRSIQNRLGHGFRERVGIKISIMQKHPVEQKFNGVLFDPEKVEGAVEDAKRREAQEREQKKVKRKFSRGAR